MSSDFKINPNNQNASNQKSDRRIKKKEAPPSKEFSDVVEEIDDKRQREDDGTMMVVKKKGMPVKKTKPFSFKSLEDQADDVKNAVSIFDIAGGKFGNAMKDPEAGKETDQQQMVGMITSPYQELSQGGSNAKDPDAALKGKNDFRFLAEQPDLSAITPVWLEAQQSVTTSSLQESGATTQVQQTMQEIIDKIAKEVQILEMNGQTDTVVKLNSDLFKDVNLTLTQFASATGQVNISFDNLTQAGERILQMHKAILIDALQKHDIVVQKFETATINLAPQIEAERNFTKREQGQDQNQQQGNRGNQKNKQG